MGKHEAVAVRDDRFGDDVCLICRGVGQIRPVSLVGGVLQHRRGRRAACLPALIAVVVRQPHDVEALFAPFLFRQAMERLRAEVALEYAGDTSWPPARWPPDPRTISSRLPEWYQQVLRGERQGAPRFASWRSGRSRKLTPEGEAKLMALASVHWGRQSYATRRHARAGHSARNDSAARMGSRHGVTA